MSVSTIPRGTFTSRHDFVKMTINSLSEVFGLFRDTGRFFYWCALKMTEYLGDQIFFTEYLNYLIFSTEYLGDLIVLNPNFDEVL